MNTAKAKVAEAFAASKVIAIIRGMEPEIAVKLAESYCRGGIRLVEVTFAQGGDPAPTVEAIKAIAQRLGDKMHVGAGTVLSAAQLDAAVSAGAEFMVTPNVNPEIIRRANAAGLMTAPGALTPTEIAAAHDAGADCVKVFPVRAFGPQYVRDVLAPLRNVKLVAVGGVNAANAADYIAAGCVGIGASGALCDKSLIADGDWGAIEVEARKIIAAVHI